MTVKDPDGSQSKIVTDPNKTPTAAGCPLRSRCFPPPAFHLRRRLPLPPLLRRAFMAPTTRKMAYPAADAVPSAAAAIPPLETADRSLETVDTPSVLVEFLPATAATENLATAAATENLDTAAATEDLDPAATGDLDLAATVQRPSRRFALQNGINCLLISDPDVTKVSIGPLGW